MLLNLKIFILALLTSDICLCETKVENNTTISRREILEQQARTAYQNTCYRLQELSNWMTAVFRIKSVWATATVNEIASRSEGSWTESDRRNKIGLPTRSRTISSECSLSSVQVTAQTFAYLQSQLVMMKWLLGRNIFKSSKERFEGAKERMRMLDTFNNTLNDVVSKLKQNTQNSSSSVDSESWTARNLVKDVQEGRFLQLLQSPKTILMKLLEDQVLKNRTRNQTGSRNLFQNLGKNLDKLIFSVTPVQINTNSELTDGSTEHPHTNVDHPSTSVKPPDTTVTHSADKASTNDVVMFSSIL